MWSNIWGNITYPKDINTEIEVHTYKDRPKTPEEQFDMNSRNVIQYKPSQLKDIEDYLAGLNTL